jgi:hypothetical protein
MTTKRLLGFAALIASVAGVVGFTAGALAKGPPVYWVKDYVIPFWAPFVSLCGAFGFVWWLPKKQADERAAQEHRRADERAAQELSQAQKRLALELWQAFNSDEMRRARLAGWRYLNTDVKDIEDRRRKVWMWAHEARTQIGLDDQEVTTLQQVLRVFEFFSACDAALANDQVDSEMLYSLLGHAFFRWSEEAINPVRAHPFDQKEQFRGRPKAAIWLDGMPSLARLSEQKRKANSAANRVER